MATNHIDIVVPFVHSINGDEELRFALRSAEKFIPNLRNVYIAGAIPKWKPVNVLYSKMVFNAPMRMHKDRNIMLKILAAVHDDRVTDNFIVLHDDNYLLKPSELDTYYHQGNNWNGRGIYGQTEQNTIELLREAHLPLMNYDVHAPHTFNKMAFLKAVPPRDWTKAFGYCIKTLYGAFNGICGTLCTDLKIPLTLSEANAEQAIRGRMFFSTMDEAPHFGLLNKLYPEKSKYER